MNNYNIVWITSDEMRAEAVSAYGNPYTKMEAAEHFASNGVIFSNAFAQMPKCVPSRVSMMTGRYPHTEGFRTLMGRKHFPAPPEGIKKNDLFVLYENDINLISILKEKGYKTCLLGKNHLTEWNFYKKIFDKTSSWDFDDPIYEEEEISNNLKKAQFAGKISSKFNFQRHRDKVTADEAVDFIRKNKNNNFFAIIDMQKPHPPYEEYPTPVLDIPLTEFPPPPYNTINNVPEIEKLVRKSKNLEGLDTKERKRILRAYYSMCEFADIQIKKIIDEIEKSGLKEKTLIIYSADHGDFAGFHNCYEKWDTLLYDAVVKVPLILQLPGVITQNKKIDSLVELIDVMPTILEILNIDIPETVHGKSLLPILKGKTEKHKETVFAQGGVEQEATLKPGEVTGEYKLKQQVLIDYPKTMFRTKMIRTERFKYIYRLESECELYDLQNDPDELNNLINNPNYENIISLMKDKLLKFLVKYETNLPLIDKLYV